MFWNNKCCQSHRALQDPQHVTFLGNVTNAVAGQNIASIVQQNQFSGVKSLMQDTVGKTWTGFLCGAEESEEGPCLTWWRVCSRNWLRQMLRFHYNGKKTAVKFQVLYAELGTETSLEGH